MNQLNTRKNALEKRREESNKHQVQEESRKSALEHLERFCDEIASGLDLLTFEEQQKLLRLVVERTVVKDNRVRIETVIPTDKQHAGLLSTRHPELDSGSLSPIAATPRNDNYRAFPTARSTSTLKSATSPAPVGSIRPSPTAFSVSISKGRSRSSPASRIALNKSKPSPLWSFTAS